MSTVTVQPDIGPRNATSDPETGLRYYEGFGHRVPSVTSIRRLAGVPFNLVNWQISRVVGRVCGRVVKPDGQPEVIIPGELDTLTAMLTRERRKRERVVEKNRIKEASKWLRAAATEERDWRAAIGTAVHDAAAQGMTAGDVPDLTTIHKDGQDIEVPGEEIRPRLMQYLDWLRVTETKVLLVERQAWHLGLGYAGSFDLLTEDPYGNRRVVDIKTGNGVYSDHLLQLLAYLMAEFIGADDVVDEPATELLRAATGIGVLHLSEDGWEYLLPRHDALPAAWEAFKGLLTFAAWTAEAGEPNRWIEGRRKGHHVDEPAVASPPTTSGSGAQTRSEAGPVQQGAGRTAEAWAGGLDEPSPAAAPPGGLAGRHSVGTGRPSAGSPVQPLDVPPVVPPGGTA